MHCFSLDWGAPTGTLFHSTWPESCREANVLVCPSQNLQRSSYAIKANILVDCIDRIPIAFLVWITRIQLRHLPGMWPTCNCLHSLDLRFFHLCRSQALCVPLRTTEQVLHGCVLRKPITRRTVRRTCTGKTSVMDVQKREECIQKARSNPKLVLLMLPLGWVDALDYSRTSQCPNGCKYSNTPFIQTWHE